MAGLYGVKELGKSPERRCPFCTGVFFVAPMSKEEVVLCHSLPLCGNYIGLAPDAFLRAVEQATGRPH